MSIRGLMAVVTVAAFYSILLGRYGNEGRLAAVLTVPAVLCSVGFIFVGRRSGQRANLVAASMIFFLVFMFTVAVLMLIAPCISQALYRD